MTSIILMRAAILSLGLFMVWPADAVTYVEGTCNDHLKRIVESDYVCTSTKDWPSKLEDAKR